MIGGERGETQPAEEPLALRELAMRATTLRARAASAPPAELLEATAALQALALGAAERESPETRAALLSELRGVQAGLEVAIELEKDGPYLVTNIERLVDHLGCDYPVAPQVALCRCGRSQIKPYCDGSHADVGFPDEKSPDRQPDRLDTCVGQQVTILDNRGTCQHSCYCTDRLATVFRAREEPFVHPSGGRMDEIIRTVRDCPSGALSYALDGVEARDAVDHHGRREPVIEVTKDGPYRITDGIALRHPGGEDVARNAGASREHCALCRCGQSQNKPFCSGMHWYVSSTTRCPTRAHADDVRGPEDCLIPIFYRSTSPGPDAGPLFAHVRRSPPAGRRWLRPSTRLQPALRRLPAMLSQPGQAHHRGLAGALGQAAAAGCPGGRAAQ